MRDTRKEEIQRQADRLAKITFDMQRSCVVVEGLEQHAGTDLLLVSVPVMRDGVDCTATLLMPACILLSQARQQLTHLEDQREAVLGALAAASAVMPGQLEMPA